MPNIAEYTATGDITPSDKGIQAAEVAGRRLGQFGHELQEDVKEVTDKVEQHMAVMETSELYKTGTELRMNLQQRWDQESALPENRNNPHFADQFMAEAGPLLDQWGSHAGTLHGKELAATLRANIRNEIFNHVAAGQSDMDAAHVHDNLNQTINTLGAGLLSDPSEGNLNRTLGTASDAIEGMTMAIPDVAVRERVASELKEQGMAQLVVARYQGVGESIKSQVALTGDPTKSTAYDQLGKDIANQVGFQYLSPEVQAKVSAMREESVRQGQELFRASDAMQRKQDTDAVDAKIAEVESSMFQSNGAGGVTTVVPPGAVDQLQQILRMPGAKYRTGELRDLGNAMHTATQDAIDNKETVTSHSTYLGLSGRIGSTTNPLTKAEVDAAYANHQLSNTDYHFLREAASDSKSADPKINHALTELHRWLGQIKPMIDKSDPLAGSIDQQGTEKYSYFSWDAEAAFRKAIASGQDPDAAVQGLTDPHNPRGLYHYIPQYQTTNKQGMAGVLQATRPDGVQPTAPVPGGIRRAAPPPANRGEDVDAYLKRTGQ